MEGTTTTAPPIRGIYPKTTKISERPRRRGGGDDVWSTPKLGIDIGSQLKPLTEEEGAKLKEEAAAAIEKAFEGQLDEIEKMKSRVARDFESSRRAMEFASEMRGKKESENLMSKIDSLTGDFMEKTRESRESIKLAAEADMLAGEAGTGVEVGSWGLDRYGRVVVTGSAAGGVGFLGGVTATVNKAQKAMEKAKKGGEEGTAVANENKVIIISDDRQVSENRPRTSLEVTLDWTGRIHGGLDTPRVGEASHEWDISLNPHVPRQALQQWRQEKMRPWSRLLSAFFFSCSKGSMLKKKITEIFPRFPLILIAPNHPWKF